MDPDERMYGRALDMTDDPQAAATLVLAWQVEAVAHALKRLGTNDAATPMGAIEVLSVEIKNGFERLSTSIGEGLSEIGE